MAKGNGSVYRNLRLKADTFADLSDVKFAFETVNLERLTNDGVLCKLMDCVREAEPAVWECLCQIRRRREGGV